MKPIKEILYRLRDPQWVVDYAVRNASKTYHSVSTSEFSKLYRAVRGLTYCSPARLAALNRSVQQVVANNVPGDIVECGTARGGSAAMMGLTLKQLGVTDRTLWLFDTFEGLPAPTADDPDQEIADLYTGDCLGTIEDVTATMKRLGIFSQIKMVKGLFDDTLPVTTDLKKIAILHLDGDWYNSIKTCLVHLYDKVSVGGIIQFDDYGYWEGARKAADEFFAERSIDTKLERIDYDGRLFIKRK